MLKENIHIVFGRIGRRTLIDSNAIDLNNSEIISLDDVLNIGPACDIDGGEDIQKRINWLQKIYGDYSILPVEKEYEFYPSLPVEQDLKNIETIVENADDINQLFIWTGCAASEMISTARLIYHLSKFNKPVYVANFNIPVRSLHGRILYPKALNQTDTFQVKDIFEQFELIDKKGLAEWTKLWGKVKTGKGELWILDSKGQITIENTDYIDSFLLAHCKEDFQKAARVIGETLCDTGFNVGDSYLNWRLKQLAIDGKIEAKGKLVEIRDYEVKRITIAN